MFNQPTGYLSPKLSGHLRSDGQRGVFAHRPVEVGEQLAVWGGEVITALQLTQLPAEQKWLSLQVEEELYIVSSRAGPADWMNHSCSPNAGMCGQIVVVAMRPIEPGEEVCFDYAMTDGSSYDEFDCNCGSPICRGRVSGGDWRRPELWDRYHGYFSPYLQRRIDNLREMYLSNVLNPILFKDNYSANLSES